MNAADPVTAPPRLQRFGDRLQRRQDVVRRAQWAMAGVYLFLLLGAPLFPAEPQAGVFASVAGVAEALFWGVWWPAVILSMLLLGQFWCGLLCPDGAMSEAASRRGRGWKPSAWLRRPELPLLGFALVTLSGDLADAQRSPVGTLLLVGGPSLAAVAIGAFYGRNKRVWCRHLCPMAGAFSILARASALHFKVDRAAWDAAPRRAAKPVECPLLLDVRRLTSNEKCNMCGRCSGHRDAVVMSYRPLGSEIATLDRTEARGWEAAGIVFILIGLTWGCTHWRVGPWRDGLAAAISSLAGGVEPVVALAAALIPALALGGALCVLLLAATRGDRVAAYRLAYGLIPLAGLGMFLGGLEHSAEILAREGMELTAALPWLRAAVLIVGVGWSARLGLALAPTRAGFLFYLAALGLTAASRFFAPAAIHL